MLRELGEYQAARQCQETDLAIMRATSGKLHPNTAESLNNLGLLPQATGGHQEARSCHVKALAFRREVLGDDHPQTAQSLHNLGVLMQDTGDYHTYCVILQDLVPHLNSLIKRFVQVCGIHL